MKKMDLHIHTISTASDVFFEFNINKLKEYVITKKIDVIAITNHNCFDYQQYIDICKEIPEVVVFPGIEINIGENCGHLLVIADANNILQFRKGCDSVKNIVDVFTKYITLKQLKDYFGDLKKYLLIPHFYKNPSVDKKIIEELGSDISCVEVKSPKKFIYCMKNEKYTPVYFSDYRPCENSSIFPIRQTYFNVGDLTLSAIKVCIKDKSKVALSENEGQGLFTAAPGIEISTGLNIVLGERSSGKTYTLDLIAKYNENVKYIKQFSLVESSKDKEKNFEEKITAKQTTCIKDYFSEFAAIVNNINIIDLKNDNNNIEQYLESLKKNAEETEMKDEYAKCILFSEVPFDINPLNNLKALIKAVELLLDTKEYEEIINDIIGVEKLKELHRKLIKRFEYDKESNLKKECINDLISNVKMELQANTASTRIQDIDFYQIEMNRKKVLLFNNIVNKLKQSRTIYKKNLGNFTISAVARTYTGAQELNHHSKKKISFATAFYKYNTPYEYLKELANIDGLDESTYYEYFLR